MRIRNTFLLTALVLLLTGCATAPAAPGPTSGNDRAAGDRILSAEKALELARSADPRAAEQKTKWQAPQYAPDAEVKRNGTVERHKAWVLTGAYPDGQQVVVQVDVTTGDVLSTVAGPGKKAEPSTGPAAPKVSQEKLKAVVAATAPNAEVKSTALYEFPQKSGQWTAIYVVTLVTGPDKRPAGTLVIDAYTGDLLTTQNPPSGG